jgi:hypothetical protein
LTPIKIKIKIKQNQTKSTMELDRRDDSDLEKLFTDCHANKIIDEYNINKRKRIRYEIINLTYGLSEDVYNSKIAMTMAMGLHDRCGKNSAIRLLRIDLIMYIMKFVVQDVKHILFSVRKTCSDYHTNSPEEYSSQLRLSYFDFSDDTWYDVGYYKVPYLGSYCVRYRNNMVYVMYECQEKIYCFARNIVTIIKNKVDNRRFSKNGGKILSRIKYVSETQKNKLFDNFGSHILLNGVNHKSIVDYTDGIIYRYSDIGNQKLIKNKECIRSNRLKWNDKFIVVDNELKFIHLYNNMYKFEKILYSNEDANPSKQYRIEFSTYIYNDLLYIVGGICDSVDRLPEIEGIIYSKLHCGGVDIFNIVTQKWEDHIKFADCMHIVNYPKICVRPISGNIILMGYDQKHNNINQYISKMANKLGIKPYCMEYDIQKKVWISLSFVGKQENGHLYSIGNRLLFGYRMTSNFDIYDDQSKIHTNKLYLHYNLHEKWKKLNVPNMDKVTGNIQFKVINVHMDNN